MSKEFVARAYEVHIGDEVLYDVDVKVEGENLVIDGRTIEIVPGSVLYHSPRYQLVDEFGGVIFIGTVILLMAYILISEPPADLVDKVFLIFLLALSVFLLIVFVEDHINTLSIGLRVDDLDIFIIGHRKEILPLFDKIEELFE